MDKFYTCEEVAERYGVKVFTVWEWIKGKKLPAVKLGRNYRIKAEDLGIFEQKNKTTE